MRDRSSSGGSRERERSPGFSPVQVHCMMVGNRMSISE
jgi:hypothetical protein